MALIDELKALFPTGATITQQNMETLFDNVALKDLVLMPQVDILHPTTNEPTGLKANALQTGGGAWSLWFSGTATIAVDFTADSDIITNVEYPALDQYLGDSFASLIWLKESGGIPIPAVAEVSATSIKTGFELHLDVGDTLGWREIIL